MGKAEIGSGDVALQLGDNDVVLRPTLKACMSLSNQRGGVTGMVQRCLDFEFDAIHSVIVAGMDGKTSRDLPELIFKTGLIELSSTCIKFLHIVANGGRPLGEVEDEEKEEPPLENSSP